MTQASEFADESEAEREGGVETHDSSSEPSGSDRSGSPTSDMEVSQAAAAALESAGPPEDLESALAVIEEFAAELGQVPVRSEAVDGVPRARRRAMEELDASCWREVLDETDLEIDPDKSYADWRPVTDAEIKFDLLIGAVALGRAPTTSEIRAYGEFNQQTYYRAGDGHDSWDDVLEWAGLPSSGTEISIDRVEELVDEVAGELPEWSEFAV